MAVASWGSSQTGAIERAGIVLDSGFPAVYERIPLLLTLRAQFAALGLMAIVFVYAGIVRPLARRPHRVTARNRFSLSFDLVATLAGVLNLIFLVAFPFAYFGRMEGGVPEFLYGVPRVATALLFIPLITAALAIVASLLACRRWRELKLSLRL